MLVFELQLTDSFVTQSWEFIVRELIGSDGELCEDARVWVLLGAACELSESLLSEDCSLLVVLLLKESVSSEESFH